MRDTQNYTTYLDYLHVFHSILSISLIEITDPNTTSVSRNLGQTLISKEWLQIQIDLFRNLFLSRGYIYRLKDLDRSAQMLPKIQFPYCFENILEYREIALQNCRLLHWRMLDSWTQQREQPNSIRHQGVCLVVYDSILSCLTVHHCVWCRTSKK